MIKKVFSIKGRGGGRSLEHSFRSKGKSIQHVIHLPPPPPPPAPLLHISLNNDTNVSVTVRKNIKDYAYIDYGFQQPLFTSQFMDLYLRVSITSLLFHLLSMITMKTTVATTMTTRMMIYIVIHIHTGGGGGRSRDTYFCISARK